MNNLRMRKREVPLEQQEGCTGMPQRKETLCGGSFVRLGTAIQCPLYPDADTEQGRSPQGEANDHGHVPIAGFHIPPIGKIKVRKEIKMGGGRSVAGEADKPIGETVGKYLHKTG